MKKGPTLRGAESMVMKFHGNARGQSSGEFSGPFCLETHIFKCSALKLSRIVRANVRLNIAIPIFP